LRPRGQHAWEFARLRFGEGSIQADQWVRRIGIDLKAVKVEEVIARLKRLRPKSPQLRTSLDSLIRYYSENASRTCTPAPGRNALERGGRAPPVGVASAVIERQLGFAGPPGYGFHGLTFLHPEY
jgi:hypothetical protein